MPDLPKFEQRYDVCRREHEVKAAQECKIRVLERYPLFPS